MFPNWSASPSHRGRLSPVHRHLRRGARACERLNALAGVTSEVEDGH
jgi:hypothetical protein